MSGIDQKEYLKKYLGIGKRSKEKKSKKKAKKALSRFKIVDDDEVEFMLNEEIKQDLEGENEDAPQIVSVIDDRPPSLRIDEVSKAKLWKPLGGPQIIPDVDKPLKFEGSLKLEKRKPAGRNQPTRSSSRDGNDVSPPRKIKREKSEDISPPRVQQLDSDCSPPRRIKVEESDTPPRPQAELHDSSPPRRRGGSADISPPRRRMRRGSSEDNSPPRHSRVPSRKSTRGGDCSPPRKVKRENSRDNSPPRRRKHREEKKKSRWADEEEHGEKLQKTLDGKTAGLQNAADLVLETQELKRREDALFQKMSSEVSGANAATVVRGKKKEVNWEEEEKKRLRQAAKKEQYDRWGKGVKQVEDANQKHENELYEMSKPLARYADDQDLEKYLKDQEREGDPMLAYIRQKRKAKAVDEGKPVLQEYHGDAPPNRFGIRPGYRWDGVNRSTGYEKEWFQVQNSRTASIEESYKWSTEDM